MRHALTSSLLLIALSTPLSAVDLPMPATDNCVPCQRTTSNVMAAEPVALSSLELKATGNVMAAEPVSLSSLDLMLMHVERGKPQVDKAFSGKPLTIGGRVFEHGVGVYGYSSLWVDLAGKGKRFTAWVGYDDSSFGGSMQFRVIGDDKELFNSIAQKNQPAIRVDLDISTVKCLLLQTYNSQGNRQGSYHADWAEATFTMTEGLPKASWGPREEQYVLTPLPPAEPRINGPAVSGCRPGNPFLYRIPTTGERPMTFTATGLPTGLTLDTATGIISGSIANAGTYPVTLTATNTKGTAQRSFRIQCGQVLALTPPMGWNNWYAHYNRITGDLILRAADLIVSNGMADFGYEYVNIDDCWSTQRNHADRKRGRPNKNPRDEQGNIIPNDYFDMKKLTDYIHGKGLKAGIYSSPGQLTCAMYIASLNHEALDAQRFADWGFDFLKYDWCTYGFLPEVKKNQDLAALKKPYRLMGDLLKQQKRDIVYNLCQYGMGEVWKWGEEVGGHSWRTSGDLGGELEKLFPVALANAQHSVNVHPGSWNDPDYILIGYVGDQKGFGLPQPCKSTPTEQYSFMSLWSIMAAPLFYSGDLERLDPFTLNILCNAEVIAINQDELGRGCRVASVQGADTKFPSFVLTKELVDGSLAVAFANGEEIPVTMTADWQTLGLRGKQTIRDPWRQKDICTADNSYTVTVPRHGTVLLRMKPVQP